MRLPAPPQSEVVRLHFFEPQHSSRVHGRTVRTARKQGPLLPGLLLEKTCGWSHLHHRVDEAGRPTLAGADRSIASWRPEPGWQRRHADLQRQLATSEHVWPLARRSGCQQQLHPVRLEVDMLMAGRSKREWNARPSRSPAESRPYPKHRCRPAVRNVLVAAESAP